MFTNKAPKNLHSQADTPEALIDSASEQAGDLAQRVVEAVRESSQQIQEKAERASANTQQYIREEPVKSLLIAAATGATLMGLLVFLMRSRNRN